MKREEYTLRTTIKDHAEMTSEKEKKEEKTKT